MTPEHVRSWLDRNALSPIEVDCITTVKLKILDGKCKMRPNSKVIMSLLYEQTWDRPSSLLGDDIHQFIATVDDEPDEHLRMQIYERRLLAETAISRPVMKAFKARIRDTGLTMVA